jgi:hypothetical protein
MLHLQYRLHKRERTDDLLIKNVSRVLRMVLLRLRFGDYSFEKDSDPAALLIIV